MGLFESNSEGDLGKPGCSLAPAANSLEYRVSLLVFVVVVGYQVKGIIIRGATAVNHQRE
jgi:hypothetical protein